jgi:RsfA family transcription factor
LTITRQDAWTQDEDILLAEVVLRHIREGGTQLSAFEEVGKAEAEPRQPADSAGIHLSESNTSQALSWQKSSAKNCAKKSASIRQTCRICQNAFLERRRKT